MVEGVGFLRGRMKGGVGRFEAEGERIGVEWDFQGGCRIGQLALKVEEIAQQGVG